MDEQAQGAKELFALYYGSLLHMHREGKSEEYRSYNISKEIEIEWFQEMIEKHSKDLSIRNWDAVASLSSIAKNYQDSSMVEKVASFAARNIMSADSIVKLMFAEGMVEIIRSNKKVLSKELLFKACKGTVEILEGIISLPLVIDPGHELEQFHIKDKRSLNSRAKQGVQAVMDILN
ncbi:hypothetical protein [Paenibacillus wynnii]|uniref:Uncharacterized protein n=1 Tax=Paenibacillus wynnii TaxID=268407 RepID=A0A098M657_9BACL|nr:hypothetical protein [Paenibacillus wynnii]KGE18049.1 hypothetical protein PWYN_26265 [Paenibacillus wynnii]